MVMLAGSKRTSPSPAPAWVKWSCSCWRVSIGGARNGVQWVHHVRVLRIQAGQVIPLAIADAPDEFVEDLTGTGGWAIGISIVDMNLGCKAPVLSEWILRLYGVGTPYVNQGGQGGA